MSNALETLKAILSEKLPDDQVQALMAEITVAFSKGSVAVGRDASEAVIVPGSHNHITIYKGIESKEDVASRLIQLYRTLQVSQYLIPSEENAQEKQSWLNLVFDELSAKYSIEKINSRLTKLEEIHQVAQISKDQCREFNDLKSRLQKLRSINPQLEEFAEISRQLLKQAIQELTNKLQELSQSQQNSIIDASSQICMQDQIDALTQFQLELEQGEEIANWIEQRLSQLIEKIVQEALNAYPEIQDTATAKQIRIFTLTVKQFIERLIVCLRLGYYDSLELPATPIILDEKIYKFAFERLREVLPERLPEKGIEQLEEYINYLIAQLPSYSHRFIE
jgi:hypothetical protein